jgi:hypothetical protein
MDRAAPRLPSRREALAGGALLVLAGCLPADDTPPPRPSPDDRLRRLVAGEVAVLAARYTAVLARFPAARDELAPLAEEHAAHVRALRPRAPGGARSPAAPSSATSSAAAPATLGEARAALAAAERSASRRRGRQALQAGPELARLLAAVGACEAAHAALLERA